MCQIVTIGYNLTITPQSIIPIFAHFNDIYPYVSQPQLLLAILWERFFYVNNKPIRRGLYPSIVTYIIPITITFYIYSVNPCNTLYIQSNLLYSGHLLRTFFDATTSIPFLPTSIYHIYYIRAEKIIYNLRFSL